MTNENHKASDIPMMDMTGWIEHPVLEKFLKRGPKLPVVRLSGVIADTPARRGGISHARVKRALEKAFAVRGAPAVALVINSPGGAPGQSQLIGGLIRQLADEKQLSVYAFVEDVAASGGYWLACAADYIYVQETSIVGSIGVVSAGFGFENLIDRHGIKRRLYTAGKEKSLLDPFSAERPEDVARLRKVQGQIHDSFIRWVRDRRGSRLMGDDGDLFEGRFWTGLDALEYGIADDIGDVRSVMREKYGDDIRFIDINPDRRRLPLPLGVSAPQLDDLIAEVEGRALWGRFGL